MNKPEFNIDVTVILKDGKLHRFNRTYGSGRFEWSRTMKAVGNELIGNGVKSDSIMKVVVIAHTDVFVYEGGEPAEILGL